MLSFSSADSPATSYLNSHPMESSRILNSLVEIVKTVEGAASNNPIDEIINSQVLRRLLSATYFRDIDTLKHSRRVGLISVGIGSRLGWESGDLRLIEVASLLHDIGKIGIPDHLLHKPGKLSPDEADYITTHHRVAVELLQACRVNPDLIDIVAQAHGVDFETNLQNHEIVLSLGARILAVSDAYEALTSAKPYRPAFSEKDALDILHDQSEKNFDRNVVAALERWLKSGEAAVLDDESAAEAAVRANAPVSDTAKANMGSICQLFQYLHFLDGLYDAFYIVDESRRVVTWSAGAARLFGFPAVDLIGHPWHRSIVASSTGKDDPIEIAFTEAKPQCHSLKLKDDEGTDREFDVQAVPIFNDNGKVVAVAELVCDGNQSKKHRGQFRKLQLAATHDALTGLVNRGELDEKIKQVFSKWEEEPTIPFSIVFLDIDHFKSINDQLSHAVGDRVLVDIARFIQDELYSGEIVGRYGGEEFVILCPETPLETALERADRVRRAIMNAKIASREELSVTASFGVSQVEIGDTPESVIKRADQALYDAKKSGRNKTCHRATRQLKELPNFGREEINKQWVHRVEIVTCVASSMLPTKLKGYVHDNMAKIIHVKEDALLLQVGAPGLFGGWGSKPDRQPLQIHIEFHDIPKNDKVAGTQKVLLKTTVEPVGRPSKNSIFQTRAMLVVESLRSYLIAD